MTGPSPRDVARARQTLRDDRKARKADRPARFAARPFPNRAKHGRERDTGYLAWLHEGLPCIGCLVLGRPVQVANPIEAAHQKLNAASRGVFKRLGVRPSDMWCLPLCVSHHREGPVCCDPAQAKFWRVVGLDSEQVADFCVALYRAYEQDQDGGVVVRAFAALAAGNRGAT